MDRHRSRPWAAAYALALTACSAGTAPVAEGGQTGSAGCTNPPDCVCDAVRATTVLRGTIRDGASMEADAASENVTPQTALEVTEVFTQDAELEPGDVVEGSFQRGLPCGITSNEALPVGTEVLAAFEHGLFVCESYEQCIAQCNAKAPAMGDAGTDCVLDCRGQTAAECQTLREGARLQGFLHLVVWQETLQLTDEVTLPKAEAAVLVDTEECRQRFATTAEVECSGVF